MASPPRSRAGESPDLDRLGEDDWVAQVVAVNGDGRRGQRRPSTTCRAIGPVVDRQEIRAIDPLPGGDDDAMRLLSRAVDTPDGPVVDPRRRTRSTTSRQRRHTARSLLVAIPLSAVVARSAHVGARRAHAAAGRADPGRGRRDRRRRAPPPGAGPDGDDEIGRLATTMNDMLARVEQRSAASSGSSPTPRTSCAAR